MSAVWSIAITLAAAVACIVTLDAVAAAEGVGAGHVCNAARWVEASPRALARAAGVSDDTYAMASILVSEAGAENLATWIAVGCATVNLARRRGKSVFTLATTSHVGEGHYGRQGRGGGPEVATSKAPTANALTVAADLLAGKYPDPTAGAYQFDTPRADLEDVDRVAANRAAQGLVSVMLPNVRAFRFWVPAQAASPLALSEDAPDDEEMSAAADGGEMEEFA